MNYRSVVVFVTATTVEDVDEKLAALQAFTEHIIPDRWAEVRTPSHQEVTGTLVLCLPLTEASAKVRTGPPVDDEADYELPVWAGEIPLRLTAEAPIDDSRLPSGIEIPAYATILALKTIPKISLLSQLTAPLRLALNSLVTLGSDRS